MKKVERSVWSAVYAAAFALVRNTVGIDGKRCTPRQAASWAAQEARHAVGELRLLAEDGDEDADSVLQDIL